MATVLPRVAVIGAGVCGLVLAQGLQKVCMAGPAPSVSHKLTPPAPKEWLRGDRV